MKQWFYHIFLEKTSSLTYIESPAQIKVGDEYEWVPPSERVRKPTKFGWFLYRIYHALPNHF